ncbi:MAG: NAD(P)/FAD-dependent oxidoreductase [Actinomycetota bacterium]|nr:NAD(P)/FAD-dependent oxidoreductase [Actinomycetota bacterium]
MSARILICGGGYVGLYSAVSLQRHLKPSEADITLVSPEMNMTYQPFMPEAAAGNIEPRHAVVPLRSVLKRVRLIAGVVETIDHDARKARVSPLEGDTYDISYDHVVVGLGSVSRVLPVPGLAENAVGFKTVAEAIYLRNKVLSCMDVAESTRAPDVRSRALTFVFVGGGYAGVEALAELEDLARYASRRYATVRREDMRWVLVEAASGILPEIGDDLGRYALGRLHERGIEVHLETRLNSAQNGVMSLSDGTTFEAETLVWTTGVKPHPAVERLTLPKDDRGRLVTDEFLRVGGVDSAWAAGDCAAVPDLATGGTAPPTAQHALREARRLGENLAATIHGRPLKPFRYKQLGTLVSLGRYKGVARVLGLRLKGFPAWFLHRTYHVLMVPTFNRKVRVIADWTVALFFKRDVVQLGSLQTPRDAFTHAAGRKPQR